LPGCAGISDPCEGSVVRVHTNMTLEEQVKSDHSKDITNYSSDNIDCVELVFKGVLINWSYILPRILFA